MLLLKKFEIGFRGTPERMVEEVARLRKRWMVKVKRDQDLDNDEVMYTMWLTTKPVAV